MNVLITNDDSIASPGIWQLASAMRCIGSPLIVAPEKEQSGMGTSFTLTSATAVREVPSTVDGVKAYAVSGTPSDCVMVGLRLMREPKIDLVVSGINYGPNCGRDIHHSGTVMATLPGYYRKIPSMAVSLAIKTYQEEPRFDVAALVAVSLAESIKVGGLPREGILNVNVPNAAAEAIKGIRVTKAAPTGYIDLLQKNPDGRYALRIGKTMTPEAMEGTDIKVLEEGYITVTPLRIDFNHHELIPRLQEGMETVEAKLRQIRPCGGRDAAP